MAKRFGRNQRRQMRQEIQRLDDLACLRIEYARKAEQHADHLSDRLNTWARDIARLMGDDSVFNERVRQMGFDSDAPMLRLPVSTRMADIAPHGSVPMQASVSTVIQALIWRLNLSRDEFEHMVRIELHNRHGETTGYALSEKHMWSERDIDALARMIAVALVRYKAQIR